MAMGYFKEAFGTFAPHTDRDAAVKFILDLVLADDRLDDLANLLSISSKIGAIEGEPGWILERRKDHAIQSAYSAWPQYAGYRAFVDPTGYRLAFPQSFYTVQTFHQYVHAAVNVYVKHRPEHADAANNVLFLSQLTFPEHR
jgi:hypothetical protein